MSRAAKLLARLQTIPADLTWDELSAALRLCGFSDVSEKGGSYRTFIDGYGHKIFLHKPHPGNTVKRYALRQVVEKLRESGVLEEVHRE